MNAGYSSGWCEESFGIPLTAVEITCKAKGDKNCTFIMAPPHKIEGHIEQYKLKSPLLHNKKLHYDIPTFFERKKLEQQLALYALIVESTEDAIFTIDLDGIITTWNRGAKKLYGYSESEVIGKHIAMLIPPDLLQEEAKMMEQIKKGKAVAQFETERLHKKGKRFPISLTVSGIKDYKGRVIGVSKIGHDISKRKKAEKALKELNNSLEILVQERTSDLQRAYDNLEARVTFRNLELERANKANLAKIEELEKQIANLAPNK
jgi:PAS domain S-box-containing protein